MKDVADLENQVEQENTETPAEEVKEETVAEEVEATEEKAGKEAKKADKKKLLKAFDGVCSRATISRALSYQNNSELAFRIRRYALANCNSRYLET
mgnify:CR=1 FL=1